MTTEEYKEYIDLTQKENKDELVLELVNYFNNIANREDQNYWFVTKQALNTIQYPYFITKEIVYNYEKELKKPSYKDYYDKHFIKLKNKKKYVDLFKDAKSVHRSTIIAAEFGLCQYNKQYKNIKTSAAFNIIKKYENDKQKFEIMLEKQVEKFSLNVLETREYKNRKEVVIFPTIFIYKILDVLFELYRAEDSRRNRSVFYPKITYDEYAFFVQRAKKYKDYNKIIHMIINYRLNKSSLDDTCIQSIKTKTSYKDIRVLPIFGELTALNYTGKKDTRKLELVNSKSTYSHIKEVIKCYETSPLLEDTSHDQLKNFMCSDKYFDGYPMDYNLNDNNINENEDSDLFDMWGGNNAENYFMDTEPYTATEGEKSKTEVERRKRSKKLADECKKRDKYTCKICGFNSKRIYGTDYANKLHAHHIIFMSDRESEYEAKLEDFISVCPNCHMILHTKNENNQYISWQELKERIKNK